MFQIYKIQVKQMSIIDILINFIPCTVDHFHKICQRVKTAAANIVNTNSNNGNNVRKSSASRINSAAQIQTMTWTTHH